MMKLYFFISDNPVDKCSGITILTSSSRRAYALALDNFIKNGYKGCPVILAIWYNNSQSLAEGTKVNSDEQTVVLKNSLISPLSCGFIL